MEKPHTCEEEDIDLAAELQDAHTTYNHAASDGGDGRNVSFCEREVSKDAVERA